MFVRDIMSSSPAVCTEEMPLLKVYNIMLENDCDFVSVIESYAHQMPIGVVTEHDICMQIVAHGRNPRNLTAANVMNTGVLKISDTSTLAECSGLIRENRTKKVLVIDENGALCGTLTQSDIDNTKTERHIDDLFGNSTNKNYTNNSINRIF